MNRAAIAALTLALPGCATQHLAVETGSALADQAGAAAAAASAYVDTVAARRIAANVVLVASDPACRWGSAIFVYQPTAAEIASDAKVPFCSAAAAGAMRYDLRGISQDRLKPTMLLVAALADYAATLDAIVAQKAPDIAARLAGINAYADEAADLLKLNGGRDPLTNDAIADIGPLLNGIAKGLAEAAEARALFAESAAEDQHVTDAIARLKAAIRAWKRSAHSDNQTTVLAMTRVFNRFGADWDFDRRQAFALRLAEADAAIARTDADADALMAALDRLAVAEADLRHIAEGRLSASQRAERARIARSQALWALGAIASAVKVL